jgi:hypothetical protein
VNEDNAPFAYVKRSHIGGRWRRKKELDAFHYGLTGDWAFFHQHEYDGVMKRWGKPLGWEKIVCTGKAGTMILFDANGLHRRELCRSGSRIVMSNYLRSLTRVRRRAGISDLKQSALPARGGLGCRARLYGHPTSKNSPQKPANLIAPGAIIP